MTTAPAAATSRDWVIPGLLRHADRLILTGAAGLGKTALCGQLAAAAAGGVHPFTLEPTQPRLVLWIDLENHPRNGRRLFRRLERAATAQGHRIPDGGLRLIYRPEGILAGEDFAGWLLERVTKHAADLLVIGPLYRMHFSGESAVVPVANALDRVRAATGCAVVVEAGAPLGPDSLATWPESGIGIRRTEEDVTVDVVTWRAPLDDGPDWPQRLTRDSREDSWPWSIGRPQLHVAPA